MAALASPFPGYQTEPIEGDSLTQALRSLFNMLGQGGKSLFDAGSAALQPAQDFWTKILSGDKSAMMSVLSPEIQRINAGYKNASNQVATYAPQGGGRSATLAEIPFAQSRDVSNLFSTLRPQAANSLASLGMGETGLAGNFFNMLGQQQLQRRQQNLIEDMNNRSLLVGGLTKLIGGAFGGGAGAAGGGGAAAGGASGGWW